MSSFSSALSCLFLLFYTLFLFKSKVYGDDPLFYTCSGPGNLNSTLYECNPKIYKANLDKLIASLSIQASNTTGFAIGFVGDEPNKAYGLAQCRSDVFGYECEKCLAEAGKELQALCHNNQSSTIWYDDCKLRYAPVSFFGQLDIQNPNTKVSDSNLTDNPGFVNTTTTFLLGLARMAARSDKATFYAAQELVLCEFLSLYGMVQCTRDLSQDDCYKCLDAEIDQIPQLFPDRQGVRFMTRTCSVRYEIYPFFCDQELM